MHKLISNVLKNNFLGECSVQGWIKTKRDSKIGLSFLLLNDGSSLYNLQIIAKKNLSNYDNILKLTTGSSIKAFGKIIESTGKKQKIELQATKIIIVSLVNNPASYPIQPKYHSLDYLRDVPYLRQRTSIFGSLNRVRSKIVHLLHNFLQKENFILINTPIITSNDCEGAGDLFEVSSVHKKEFFKKKSFLSVSGQLHLEAFALSLSKVYR